jgi:myo-inositol-1(or 4)-monophosphatase
MNDLSLDFGLLRETAREAASLAMTYWGRSVSHEKKADGTTVTAADKAVDELLAARLKAPRPHYGWLSEESPEHEKRLSAHRVWILDPIDGTRDFLHGGRDWTVALCLAEEGVPVLCAVINPVREEIFEARLGEGSWLNGHRIHASGQSELSGARIAVSPSLLKRAMRYEPLLEPSAVHANSSLYRLALVACARADASFALNPKWEWDIAAGALLVTEAGGRVTSLSGSPLTFNSGIAKVEGFVAAAPDLHQILSKGLSRIGGNS